MSFFGERMEDKISSEEFRLGVKVEASVLEIYGFRPAPQFDHETPTTSSVVYVGQNIAFVFTFDVRDQGIDLIVTRNGDGKLLTTSEGGYSAGLLSHLIKHCGFRGGTRHAASAHVMATRASQSLSALVNLLLEPCAAAILADRANALPG